jgi:hypothetical protein
MEGAPQVVLIDLPFVECPSVVLVLPDMKPRFPRGARTQSRSFQYRTYTDVHPIAGELPRSLGVLTDPRLQHNDSVAVQDCFKLVNVVLLDGALGKQHGIDAVYLVPSRNKHPVHKIQIEPFRGGELEGADTLAPQPVHRTVDGMEIGLSHPQRPRQQQHVRVPRSTVGTPTTDRRLVPVDL